MLKINLIVIHILRIEFKKNLTNTIIWWILEVDILHLSLE